MATINRFAFGEMYHCYNRGVDKRVTFNTHADHERFIELLFSCNSVDSLQRSDMGHIAHIDIFNIPRAEPLVAIGAYALMPNHFHLLLREIKEGGISLFMGRLGNSYTKYFNTKNERNGNLFTKPFRTKHVSTDGHFSHIAQYIHLNPIELFEPGWKYGHVSDIVKVEDFLKGYMYSSLPDYGDIDRSAKNVLDTEFKESISQDLPALSSILEETSQYYAELQ
jgi:putative transposase